MVRQAARQLLVLPGIEAKTRQRVDLFGQQLIGSGSYQQLVRGPRLMLRLDLKLQIGPEVATLQQISDGHFFWVRYDLPQRKSLARVNLKRLRQAAGRLPAPPPPVLWMALGGLPKLLAALSDSFQFDRPEAITIGRLPVWRITGHWKPDVLARMNFEGVSSAPADRKGTLETLPDHLPQGVTLILGRDRVIPLFPYSVAFFRYLSQRETESGPRRRRPITTLELFEVRLRPDLLPEHFEYRPGDQEVQEQTDRYVARLTKLDKRAGSNGRPSPSRRGTAAQ